MKRDGKGFIGKIMLGLTVVLLGGQLTTSPCLAEWVAKDTPGTQAGAVQIDENNASTVYVGTSAGVYKSTDLGANWQYMGLRYRGVDALTQNSQCDASLLAAAWNSLYVSSDGGATWSEEASIADNINAVRVSLAPDCVGYLATDNGIYTDTGNAGLGGMEVVDIEIDSGGNAYAATGDGEIYKSTDDGGSWVKLSETESMIWDLYINDTDDIYAATLPSGILKSTDGGANWTAMVTGLPKIDGSSVYAVNAVGGVNSVVYAGVASSVSPLRMTVYKSVNNGATWVATDDAVDNYYDIDTISVNSNGIVFVGTGYGMYRSDDNGASWVDLTTGIKAAPLNNSLVQDPDGTLFVGSDGSGIYKSSNGGESWTRAGSGYAGRVESMFADSDGNLYATNNSTGGVYKSVDNGATWSSASSGLPSMSLNDLTVLYETYSLTMDAAGRLYVGLTDGVDYPVYYSDDQGSSWSAAGALPSVSSEIKALAAGSGAVYAGTSGQGVYKSTDSGASWTALTNGLPDSADVAANGLVIDDATGDIYAVFWGHGVYRSSDQGQSWTPVNPKSDCDVSSVTVDRSGDLYAVACSSAVFKSSDNGTTWTEMSEGLSPYDDVNGINVKGIFAGSDGKLFLATQTGMYVYNQFSWILFMPAIINGR